MVVVMVVLVITKQDRDILEQLIVVEVEAVATKTMEAPAVLV
jgi:hypothetical protein